MSTAPTKTIRLHPAQADFLRSNALFRAFCGGIGSGKSWAGSYDLIRRAQPGRLYLVMAPTYAMLSDATFRSFLAVAEALGIVDPAEVKRSAPPSIRLRTGAEVLFRSADDPDRLRGPNLSGCWLDEASLMHEDVFSIAIGRLREGGQQGWLTATFTPKGRQHWTFTTFATGRPDTAIFRARTRDNPFLPGGFDTTVRQQYTTHLASQELEGEFIDAAGVLFQRGWFSVLDEVPQLVRAVRSWDLAATPEDEEKARDPDWTAGALLAHDADRIYYVCDVARIRGTPADVERLILATAEADGRGVWIHLEQEPGSAGKTVVDRFRKLLNGYRFLASRPTGSKIERARPLAALAEQGSLKLLRGEWNAAFLDEVSVFPFGRHDDQVDGCSGGYSALSAVRELKAAHFSM